MDNKSNNIMDTKAFRDNEIQGNLVILTKVQYIHCVIDTSQLFWMGTSVIEIHVNTCMLKLNT